MGSVACRGRPLPRPLPRQTAAGRGENFGPDATGFLARRGSPLPPTPCPRCAGEGENSYAPRLPRAQNPCHPEAQAHRAGLHLIPRAPKDLACATSQLGRGSEHQSLRRVPRGAPPPAPPRTVLLCGEGRTSVPESTGPVACRGRPPSPTLPPQTARGKGASFVRVPCCRCSGWRRWPAWVHLDCSGALAGCPLPPAPSPASGAQAGEGENCPMS
jgi:hypothetical protein